MQDQSLHGLSSQLRCVPHCRNRSNYVEALCREALSSSFNADDAGASSIFVFRFIILQNSENV